MAHAVEHMHRVYEQPSGARSMPMQPNHTTQADDYDFFADTSSSVSALEHSARQSQSVTFRPRTPSRRSGRGGSPAPRAPKTLVLAVVATIAIAVAGTFWSFAGAHSASATSSAAGPSPAKAAAGVAINSSRAKKGKKRKANTKKNSATKAKTAPGSSAKRSASASAPAKGKSPTTASTGTSRDVASLSRNVVVIDAGHQARGNSSLEPVGPGSSQKKAKVADGTSGSSSPHDESAVNLQVALKLRSALEARGVKVVMVRTSQNVDISNSQRAAIANKAHAALFIRLHCDGASNSSTHGLSTLVPARNHWTAGIVPASAKAGRFLHKATLRATGAADRGVVNRGDLSGFNWSKVPTVLVEMGFMSNRAEDRLLTSASYQQKLATGLANGAVDYLKSR